LCDGDDDCGDSSDENFGVDYQICNGYYVNNFESESTPWGIFKNEQENTLQWRVSIPEWLDRGMEMF
jgi:hypothetical protein